MKTSLTFVWTTFALILNTYMKCSVLHIIMILLLDVALFFYIISHNKKKDSYVS